MRPLYHCKRPAAAAAAADRPMDSPQQDTGRSRRRHRRRHKRPSPGSPETDVLVGRGIGRARARRASWDRRATVRGITLSPITLPAATAAGPEWHSSSKAGEGFDVTGVGAVPLLPLSPGKAEAAQRLSIERRRGEWVAARRSLTKSDECVSLSQVRSDAAAAAAAARDAVGNLRAASAANEHAQQQHLVLSSSSIPPLEPHPEELPRVAATSDQELESQPRRKSKPHEPEPEPEPEPESEPELEPELEQEAAAAGGGRQPPQLRYGGSASGSLSKISALGSSFRLSLNLNLPMQDNGSRCHDHHGGRSEAGLRLAPDIHGGGGRQGGASQLIIGSTIYVGWH